MIISIIQKKGGVGKTSLSTNLAALLSKKKKVLLLDMDSQSDCAASWAINPSKIKTSMYDVLLTGKPLMEILIPLSKSLYLAPSNDDMDSFVFSVLTNTKTYNKPFDLLTKAVQPIKSDFDYIIIDTPPSLELGTGNALAASDEVIIPYLPEPYGNKGLIKVINTVHDFRSQINPVLTIKGVVGMMVDTRTHVHSDMLQQARAECFKKKVTFFNTTIPKSIRQADATAYEGNPIVLSRRGSKVADAYNDLLEEMFDDK